MTRKMTLINNHPPRANFWSRLRRDQSGLAVIEFALSLPVFLGVGMFGSESAFLFAANTKVSQAALNLADNAARLGQNGTGTGTPTITDADVKQTFDAVALQTSSIDLLANGRVILSSLEVGDRGGGVQQQFIRWQRCLGRRNDVSDYGVPTTVTAAPTTFLGMGPSTARVQATANTAVMFVEIEYRHQPLFGEAFLPETILRQEAAYNIRDDRNLAAGLTNNIGANAATCNKFTVS